MRGRSRFKPKRYRAEKMRALTCRVEFLEAERARLESLLATSLEIATAREACGPLDLLRVIADLHGTDLSRSAWVVQRETQARERRHVELVQLLRETDPERIT